MSSWLVDINGHPTWVDDRAPNREGSTVLLLHGGLSDSNLLVDNIASVLEDDHRIVAFDRRGHGFTADTDAPFHYDDMATETTGVIENVIGHPANLGCGPGHVVSYLSELGLETLGVDLSPGLIAKARRAFPDSRFEVGDLTALETSDSSLGGIVARYSLIHMLPARHQGIFDNWPRVLEPGAPVLVSFFAAPSAEAHGTPFDHAVATAYSLFPATIAKQLALAGFGHVEIGLRNPLEGERQLNHGTVLARNPIA